MLPATWNKWAIWLLSVVIVRCCFSVISVTDCSMIMSNIISSENMSTIHMDLKNISFGIYLDFLNERKQRTAFYAVYYTHPVACVIVLPLCQALSQVLHYYNNSVYLCCLLILYMENLEHWHSNDLPKATQLMSGRTITPSLEKLLQTTYA